MTPSANSDAISAQQQPTHQAPCRAPISQRAGPAVAPGAEQEAERAAALPEADVLERRQLVDGRDDERRPGDPAPRPIPREHVAGERLPATANATRRPPRPDDEVARREQQRRQRRALPRHARVQRHRRRDRREHHRRHHHDPRRRGTSRACPARSRARRPCPASDRPSTTSRRAASAKSTRDEPEPRARGRADAGARPAPPGARSGADAITAQAAQENSDVDSPVLPSYSMPNALIRERFASAIVRSDADRVEHAVEPDRPAGLDAERHDVLDLEVDRVADADAVTQPVVAAPRSAPARRRASRRPAARARPSDRRAAR